MVAHGEPTVAKGRTPQGARPFAVLGDGYLGVRTSWPSFAARAYHRDAEPPTRFRKVGCGSFIGLGKEQQNDRGLSRTRTQRPE